MSYTTFYHYTSRYGQDAIITSGYIHESAPRHSRYGSGTYGTGLPPSAGKCAIAANNWTGLHASNYINSGSVDYAFEIKIPSEKVKKAPTSRNILVHPGQIMLKDYVYTVIPVTTL